MNNKKPSKIATTITTILIFFVVLFWTFGSFMGILSTCQEREKASAASQYITAELPTYSLYPTADSSLIYSFSAPLYIRFTTESNTLNSVSFYTWSNATISESSAINTQSNTTVISIPYYRFNQPTSGAPLSVIVYISSAQIANIPDSFTVSIDSTYSIRYQFNYQGSELFYILFNGGATSSLFTPYLPASYSQTFPFVYSYGYIDSSFQSEAAYNQGYNEGRNVGYNEGYNEARELFADADTSFGSLFLAIAEVPYNIISSMFSFELFGYDMSQFVFSLITVIVIICVVRWFI